MIGAIVGHLVGDFLFQCDWVARLKKVDSRVCLVHCLMWTVMVCEYSGWWDVGTFVWLLATHFVIDRTEFVKWWMRWVGQKDFMQPPFAPWSIVVIDQIFHILTLWAADHWHRV